MLVDRKQGLNRLERLLVDVHTVAKDIGAEVVV
jgi:hypothetical protein